MAVGFGVQAVPTALIATASINLGLWFTSLPFSYYATLQVVHKFNKLDKNRQNTLEVNRQAVLPDDIKGGDR